MKFEYPKGATPLNPDEINGLIPRHITTQNQLNEWEATNILVAEEWAFTSTHSNFLTIEFIQLLHTKMFNKTWKWAGTFRKSEKNIGIDFLNIRPALTNLLDDVICQITNTSYSIDEIAYRFHHRLVAIHPFPNGNGRHARMMTDILLVNAGQPRFPWGQKNLTAASSTRGDYIAALESADKHDYSKLAAFVRS